MLVHLWSLAVEEQFYLIWPFVILIVKKPKTLFFIMLGVLIFVIAARSVLWLYHFEDISIAVTLVLTVIENITVTESISNSSESSISVFDGVNVSEDFSSLIVTQPVFTVVEDIVVSENIAFDILVVVNVFDSVGVSDEFSPSVVSFVSVNDSISLSDTYGFVTNIYGYNVPEYRPIGTIVSYNQLMGDAE